jgi:hypothetical protein
MAFRLELSASFDYFDNLFPDFPRLVARTSFSSTVLFRSRKSLTLRISSSESDATVLAFLLWLRRRPL